MMEEMKNKTYSAQSQNTWSNWIKTIRTAHILIGTKALSP